MIYKNDFTNGVSATDVSVLFGHNKYRTPIDLFQIKTGAVKKQDDAGEAAHWGKVLEPVIAQHFADSHKGWHIDYDDSLVRAEGDLKFICGKYDGVITKEEGIKSILEVKTCSAFLSGQWGQEHTDEIPSAYAWQIQTYLLISGLSKVHLAVLIGGQAYKEFIVNADSEMHEQIAKKATSFWKCVVDNHLTDEFAQPSDHKKKPITQDVFQADLFTEEEIYRLSEVKKASASLKHDEKDLIEDILLRSGNSTEIINHQGNLLATYKSNVRKTFDSKRFKKDHPDQYEKYLKESETRTFRLYVKT